MKKPVLIIMAAGMGSRYGKLKQIEPVDEFGHMLIDYSIYDAKRAGFETVIFVINPEMETVFKERIGERISSHMNVIYVHQLLTDVPNEFITADSRTKPWGTAHAVMSARHVVDSPFAVINADDYYGQSAVKSIYDFLVSDKDENAHAMIGYKIENSLTEHGSVSRGICETDDDLFLTKIVERTRIERQGDGAVFYDEKNNTAYIPRGTFVSLNLWGFSLCMMDELAAEFAVFLKSEAVSNPLAEFYLPTVPGKLIEQGKAKVKVLETDEKWYGVTYKQDMAVVRAALKQMINSRKYPENLWENDKC